MLRQILARLSGRFDWRHSFSAFRYRNYRLWFYGQAVSLFGTWMQSTAQGYLIYQLTNQSAAYLGYISFATGLPSWLFMLWGGVIADRVSRRKMMVITQSSMLLLAFVLAGLTFADLVQPWHILVLAFLLGVANAFDAPARLAFTLEMVEREDLANAVALNGTMFNLATALGPAVGGLIYAAVGPGWCFTINGITFIAIIVALLLMRVKPLPQPAQRRPAVVEMWEGIRYALTHPAIRTLIGVMAGGTFFGMMFVALIPAWAVRVLNGDATTNGLLQSARGLGALISAFVLAAMGRFNFKGKLLTLGSLLFPAILLAFALVRWTPLSLVLLVGVGVAMVLVLNLASALMQILTPDAMRGRVMGLYSFVFFGLMTISGLVAGPAAELVGEQTVVASSALATLVLALLMALLAPRVRALE